MRLLPILFVLAALIAAASPVRAQPAPHVAVRGGNITYTGADGVTRTLTTGGHFSDPALSPDGHTVAFLHEEHQQTDTDEAVSSLWIADGLTGHADRTQESGTPQDPRFSLSGGFVYVTEWTGGPNNEVYQVNVTTGQSRRVTYGDLKKVIQTGPYSGDLEVDQSGLDQSGGLGTGRYWETRIVRPDGKVLKSIPGTRYN